MDRRLGLVLVLGALLSGCAGRAALRPAPSPLRAAWYLVPAARNDQRELVVTLLNKGDQALTLSRIVVNEADDGGWEYERHGSEAGLAIASGHVIVLRLADFQQSKSKQRWPDADAGFGCRLPVSLVATAEAHGRIVAEGLPSPASALPGAIPDKCDGRRWK
jgi:hypothetical protein